MIEEAAGTRLYESKKESAQKTIEKKDAKLKEIDTVSKIKLNYMVTYRYTGFLLDWKVRGNLEKESGQGNLFVSRKSQGTFFSMHIIVKLTNYDFYLKIVWLSFHGPSKTSCKMQEMVISICVQVCPLRIQC